MMRAVDLFAGAGGFTSGAKAAGIDVVFAANHWMDAVEAHERAHPDVEHDCQDLRQFDWSTLPDFEVLLASPECKGHTKAKGKERKHHDASRATSWAVIDCAETCRPPLVVVENVPEFLDWELFPSWADAMRRLGYTLSPHIFDSADVGVPQNRVRMFLIGSLDGEVEIEAPHVEHVSVRSVLDLDNVGGPVYTERRAANTISRHEAGRRNVGDIFLAPFYGAGSGKTGRSIDRPCGTLTTKARWSLHNGDSMRMLTTEETLAIGGFPASYLDGLDNWTKANTMIGNAVTPAMGEHVCSNLPEVR